MDHKYHFSVGGGTVFKKK